MRFIKYEIRINEIKFTRYSKIKNNTRSKNMKIIFENIESINTFTDIRKNNVGFGWDIYLSRLKI